MKKTRLVAITAVTAALLGAGAAPALAMNEVNVFSCTVDFSGEFLQLGYRYSSGLGGYSCYANSGEINVNKTNVERFSSGNNAGWFIYNPGDGYEYRHSFAKWDHEDGINDIHVYEVHIYAPNEKHIS